MGLLAKVLAVVVVIWLVLMPPLFTGGACTQEFDRESARMQADAALTKTPEAAATYWQGRGMKHTVLSVEQCRKTKPRWLAHCGDGVLVYARVPVENLVCRLYRDDDIEVRRQYDKFGRLERMQADMDPFKSLLVPLVGTTIYWAR